MPVREASTHFGRLWFVDDVASGHGHQIVVVAHVAGDGREADERVRRNRHVVQRAVGSRELLVRVKRGPARNF